MKKKNSDFLLAGRKYKSRLIIGTGKYENYAINKKALEASEAEIVTIAMRRVNIKENNKEKLTDFINPKKYTFMPNTAGCFSSEDAIRTLMLAREINSYVNDLPGAVIKIQ